MAILLPDGMGSPIILKIVFYGHDNFIVTSQNANKHRLISNLQYRLSEHPPSSPCYEEVPDILFSDGVTTQSINATLNLVIARVHNNLFVWGEGLTGVHSANILLQVTPQASLRKKARPYQHQSSLITVLCHQ